MSADERVIELMDEVNTLKQERDLLAKTVDELRGALEEQLRWLGKTGDAIKDFDDIAEWFHGATGIMRPGKDQGGYGHSDDERSKTFRGWSHKMGLEIRQRTIQALATIRNETTTTKALPGTEGGKLDE